MFLSSLLYFLGPLSSGDYMPAVQAQLVLCNVLNLSALEEMNNVKTIAITVNNRLEFCVCNAFTGAQNTFFLSHV